MNVAGMIKKIEEKTFGEVFTMESGIKQVNEGIVPVYPLGNH
jgi:hypothetical protein